MMSIFYGRRFQKLLKLLVLIRYPTFRKGLKKGVAAAIEHWHILDGLQLKTVIDIGANVGQFALLLHQIYPRARIISFEPLSRPAQIYQQLFNDIPEITLHQMAIAPLSAEEEMHVSGHDDSSSLLPISDKQVEFAPGTQQIGVERVIIRPLDAIVAKELIQEPSLLKLDVQGYELEALKGCKALFDVFTYIYVEVSFTEFYEGQALAPEIIDWLGQRGFVLTGAANPTFHRGGGCAQVDLLFHQANLRHAA